jgi:hypothetical protein
LLARDDHRLVIDLRIKLKESLDELASQQFQAVEAASELERCRTSRAELQLALEEEKQKIVRMRLANDEMMAELRQCRARAEKQSEYIQKKVRCCAFRNDASCPASCFIYIYIHHHISNIYYHISNVHILMVLQEATWRRLQSKFAENSKGTVEGGGSHDFLDLSEVGRSGDDAREGAAEE